MYKIKVNTNSGKDDKSKQDKENKSNDKKTAPVATTQLAEPLPDNAIVIEHAKLKYFVDVFNEYSIARNYQILKVLRVFVFEKA